MTEEEYQRLRRALAETMTAPTPGPEAEEDVDEVVRALESIPPIAADQELEDRLLAIVLREGEGKPPPVRRRGRLPGDGR